MVKFEFKRFGIKYQQVWFNSQSDLAALRSSGCDILEFKESYVTLPSLYSFVNGVIDLSASLDSLHDKFDKGFKYEVRRAEKENCECEILDLSSDEALAKVFERYTAFCDEKAIPFTSMDFIKLYRQSGNLYISVAKVQGEIVQYHMYFKSPTELILLASFPQGNTEHIKKTLIGFANRYLHWFDIRYAFQEKIGFYNLGGMGNSNNPHTAGIVKFKMEMAPQLRTYYQGLIGISFKGKCFLKLKKVIGKV